MGLVHRAKGGSIRTQMLWVTGGEGVRGRAMLGALIGRKGMEKWAGKQSGGDLYGMGNRATARPQDWSAGSVGGWCVGRFGSHKGWIRRKPSVWGGHPGTVLGVESSEKASRC